MQDDGFEAAIKLLRAHSIDLLGTLEVIHQQAPLFEQKHEIGSMHRTQTLKLLTELTQKVSKLGSTADKVMSLVFVGDPDEIKSKLPTQAGNTDSDTIGTRGEHSPTDRSETDLGHSGSGHH